MAFYTDISLVYDDLFPVSPNSGRCSFPDDDGGVRSVVDCGADGSQLQPFAVAVFLLRFIPIRRWSPSPPEARAATRKPGSRRIVADLPRLVRSRPIC